jgi:hypothetical protein
MLKTSSRFQRAGAWKRLNDGIVSNKKGNIGVFFPSARRAETIATTNKNKDNP